MQHRTYNAKTVTIAEIKAIAQMLIDGEHADEYTRGICELIADLDAKEDMPTDQRAKEIANELGVEKEVIDSLW